MNYSSPTNFEYEMDYTDECPFFFKCEECCWDCGDDDHD